MAEKYDVCRYGNTNWEIQDLQTGARIAVVYGGSLERARAISSALEFLDAGAKESGEAEDPTEYARRRAG